MSDLILYGLIVHLVADWVFQNHWMAINKANVRHPAGYVHASIHTLGALLVFPPAIALVLGVLHFLIDTRKPMQWWQRVYQQTIEGPYAIHVQIWLDQVFHVIVIVICAWLAVNA